MLPCLQTLPIREFVSTDAVLFVVYFSTSIHFAKLTQRETEIDSDLLTTLLKSALLILIQFFLNICLYI